MSPWKRNTLLVIALLALLSGLARIAWKISEPYRSERTASKIRQAIGEDRAEEALELFHATRSSLTDEDRYSCMLAMAW